MIIIAGTFDFDPADRDAFLAATEPLMRASLAENGCHAYSFSADRLDPGRVNLYELWDDDASLERHRETEHYRGFGQNMANSNRKGMNIRQFNATEVPR
jgi:quinol monooxygenase YgiN